MFHLINIYTV